MICPRIARAARCLLCPVFVLLGCLILLPVAQGGIDALRATALPPQPAFAQSVLGGERIRKRIRRGQVLGFNI